MANTTWSASDKTGGVTLSGSNLIATSSASGNGVRAADKQTANKYYWETVLTTAGIAYGVGAANGTATLSSVYTTPTGAAVVYASGSIWINNTNTGTSLGSLAAGGVVVCHALDVTGALYWARSGAAGNWNNSGTANPATGAGGLNVSSLGGSGLYPLAAFGVAATLTARFGDSAFTGTVPSGFTSGWPGAGSAATTQARAWIMA